MSFFDVCFVSKGRSERLRRRRAQQQEASDEEVTEVYCQPQFDDKFGFLLGERS